MTRIINKDKNNAYHNRKNNDKNKNYNNNTAPQMTIKTQTESN